MQRVEEGACAGRMQRARRVGSQVAMAHSINASVVHRWRQLCQGQAPTELAKTSEFIALPLPAPSEPTAVAPDVRIELRRGPVSVSAVCRPYGGRAHVGERGGLRAQSQRLVFTMAAAD